MLLARHIVVRWALKPQLQISFPHGDRAELRPEVKNPQYIFRKTGHRFANDLNGILLWSWPSVDAERADRVG